MKLSQTCSSMKTPENQPSYMLFHPQQWPISENSLRRGWRQCKCFRVTRDCARGISERCGCDYSKNDNSGVSSLKLSVKLSINFSEERLHVPRVF